MIRLRWMLLGSIAILLALWWWHNQERDVNLTTLDNDAPLLVLENVTSYHFNVDGVRDITLFSPQLTHYDDLRGSDYLEPVVQYAQGEKQFSISADKGHLDEHKTLITFTDNVLSEEFINDNRLRWLTTTVLNYQLNDKIMDTDADVVITTPNSLTYASGATWHVRQESFILKENVRSKYAF